MVCKVLYMLLIALAVYVVCTVAMGKSLKDYFKCPPCDEAACEIPQGCTTYVKEPGVCGCCLMCARGEGEPCGVFTARCAPGLRCQPINMEQHAQNKASAAWNAFFSDKGICVPSYGEISCFMQGLLFNLLLR